MQHKDLYFKIVIGAIVALGLVLRLFNYASLPGFDETADEFMYPWAGMSFLQTGVPTSWSGINSYTNKEEVTYWDNGYTLVTPWVHKPLLYPVITGGFMMMNGATQFDEVEISKLRLIPITLGTLTILLIAIYGALAFNRPVAIVSSLLYATIPTIVISGRLSLIENAMIPLIMIALLLFSTKNKYLPPKAQPYLLGAIAALAILLKQTGIFIAIAGIIYYLLKKRFKESIIVAAISLMGILIYMGLGSGYVGLQELIRLNTAVTHYHNGGLPQLVNAIFRYPMIVNKNAIFVDPFIFAGYIFLFSSPWWLPQLTHKKPVSGYHMLILLPFAYLLVMLMLETGNSRIYGWHFFPLFPFISILLGVMWHKLYTKGTFLQILGAFLMLSSAVAWLITVIPSLKPNWHFVMGLIIIAVLLIAYSQKMIRSAGLIIILIALVCINIFIVYEAPNILPTKEQPLSASQISESTRTKVFK